MTLAGETILITGFPAFAARRLVLRLLEIEPTLQLILLRRASDAESSTRVLAELAPESRRRVRELEGDPASLDFGLTGAEYRALSAEVERIFHFASVLESAERSAFFARQNVACAREVLELASATKRLRGIVLLSSVTVSGSRTGHILEEQLNEGQSFRSKLDESLATVELMFANQPNPPQIVLRPTQIVGDSRSGEIDRLGFPYPWLVFIDRSPEELVLPVPQRADATLQMVPIDYVVQAAVFLAARPEAYGLRYQLVDPSPPTLREFLELTAGAAGKRITAHFNAGSLTRGLALSPALRLFSQGARGLLDLFSVSPQFDTRNTRAVLSESGLECPHVSSYVGTLLARARAGYAAREVEPEDLASGHA